MLIWFRHKGCEDCWALTFEQAAILRDRGEFPCGDDFTSDDLEFLPPEPLPIVATAWAANGDA